MSEEIEITIAELRCAIIEKNKFISLHDDGSMVAPEVQCAMNDFADVMMKAFLLWYTKLSEEEKIEEQEGIDPHEVARTYVEMFKKDVTSIKGKWT